MSKLKSDLIQKKYKDNFFCKNGHNVYWTGGKYIGLSELKCEKCGVDNTNNTPIRWACEQCKLYYCSLCLKLIVDKYCPKKHKLKFFKQNSVEYFSTFTCDDCFEKDNTKDGLLFDKDCNLTFCPGCYYETSDVPEVLED